SSSLFWFILFKPHPLQVCATYYTSNLDQKRIVLSMEETIFYISLSLILIFIGLRIYISNQRHKGLPPSPLALPIVGHLHLLKPFPLHRSLYSLAQKYGPIISLRFGSRLVVVVSSLPAVEECFTKNDIIFANRPKLLMGKHLGYNYTTMTQAPYGDHWRNLRRIGALEIFSTHRLNMFLGIRKDEIRRLILKLATNGSLTKQGSAARVVELKSLFQELTFNIMMRMVAGKRYYGDDATDEEAKLFRETMAEVVSFGGASNPGDFLPILNWIDGGDFEKRVKTLAKKMDKFLQGLIEELRRKKEDLDNARNTMIDHLLSLQESEPEYYTDEIIKGLVLKAKEELDKEIGQECLVDEHHLSKLHYLHNIINETLRLYPAAPLLVPHMSSDNCTLGGYNVPRGTLLLVNAWAVHRDPTLWDDPTKFEPERFDNGEGESRKMLPFGLGRRSCPGVGLAQRVVGLTLGSLIQCFEWERVSDQEIDMAEARGSTLHKVKPL
ncbi:hypothetical protein Tsubulata_038404, partial [Turnera subulata]